MSLTACSLMLVAALSGPTSPVEVAASAQPVLMRGDTISIPTPIADEVNSGKLLSPDVLAVWKDESNLRRPSALPALYAAMGVLQALDVHSTFRALKAGASEANPAVRGAAGRTGTMLAMKALSTATAIYFTERAWKKNRKGAVVLIAAINGVTAAVVANNLKNAR